MITNRQLNRALLERQMLLDRSSDDLVTVVERMGGIQNQYAPAGYIGLWSRMRDFDRPMLTQALENRTVIQATLMRATIHVVSAADYWPMTAGIRRIRREWFEKVSRREIDKMDTGAVANATRAALADGPLPMKALTERLVARGFSPNAARWAGMWVDLVRVPPSGTWERRRADLYGLAEDWLPRVEIDEADGLAHLVRRYLGAFGPAPAKDIASWMGVSPADIRPTLERMELAEAAGEDGTVLLDLPGAPLPDPDAPAPPRFVAVWDAMLLVHARRTGVLPEELRPRVFNTRTPHSVNTFLLDGRVAGSWRHEPGEIRLEPFRALSRAEREALEAEAAGLLALHSDE